MAMKNAMRILEPELQARHEEVQRVGKLGIGIVNGDRHEIGKSLVATLLSCNGFEVCDVGVDVPTETFIAKVAETEAGLLGLSVLLTGEDQIMVVDLSGVAIQDIPITRMVDHALQGDKKQTR
jgi:methanogenic corrinoid protein MtbC1